ncbi:hypothetical protein P378_09850 [Desulforamulus profundi]|uniref:Uncharacterized protein n=1 Tax=Desulforamulus profundi TaxID=1383067 RepID=A0A2C6MFJ4_9FIRM|nr:hypothetical protein [Desulforamulus profundi]MCL4441438.1 hypothetical protein [Bacillota bacterium]MCL5780415.1 hypothetical protein [Bacillota bacterium]PHJ38462.1 hypothetical protein P378_09850 [Desulforamulus profundi]
MNRKLNWRLILSAVGFLLIGVSMFFPKETWLIISGALLFGIGMIRKPKKRK